MDCKFKVSLFDVVLAVFCMFGIDYILPNIAFTTVQKVLCTIGICIIIGIMNAIKEHFFSINIIKIS